MTTKLFPLLALVTLPLLSHLSLQLGIGAIGAATAANRLSAIRDWVTRSRARDPEGRSLKGSVVLCAADGDQAGMKLPAQVKAARVAIEVPGLRVWSIVAWAIASPSAEEATEVQLRLTTNVPG